MALPKRRRRPRRERIGKVSLYEHHGSWWVYYRENGEPVRRKIGGDRGEAEAVGAHINAQLAAEQPTLFSFEAVSVRELVRRWLDHHEHVLRSSLSTCARYRTAADHLIRFAEGGGRVRFAHDVNTQRFAPG